MMKKSGDEPSRVTQPAALETTAELRLIIEDTRDALGESHRDAQRELVGVVGSSTVAAIAFGIELVSVIRGEPVFGFFVFLLSAGFAAYFWARYKRAADDADSSEELLAKARAELTARTASREEQAG